MPIFRRRKSIFSGTHWVVIETIEETFSKSNKKFFKVTVKKKNDRAKREFWIGEESYLIEKLIDLIFEDDDREEFDSGEFIGKEIVIDVKKGEGEYYNISDIRSIDGFKEVEEDYEKEEKERLYFVDDDDFDFNDDDNFDFDNDDDLLIKGE